MPKKCRSLSLASLTLRWKIKCLKFGLDPTFTEVNNKTSPDFKGATADFFNRDRIKFTYPSLTEWKAGHGSGVCSNNEEALETKWDVADDFSTN